MSRVHIHLDPAMRGSLSHFGYHASLPMITRARALAKASAFWGKLYVLRKLHALYILDRYHRPDLSTIFKKDRDLVRAAYARERALKKNKLTL